MKKISNFINEIKNNNVSNLPNLKQIFHEHEEFNRMEEYSKIIETLLKNFRLRFKDLEVIKRSIDLHDYPLVCNIQEQKIELQEELTRMREDFLIPSEIGKHFWKQINYDKYPKLKNEIYKLYSMFGSTYNCKSAFSTMKILLNKYRNRLADNHVSDLIRIKNYESEIDIDKLMRSF